MRYALLVLALLATGCTRPMDTEREATATLPPVEAPASTDTTEGDVVEAICTDVAYAGMLVTVIDAETGTSIREGVAGIARDGAFTDTLTFYSEYRPGPSEAPVSMLSGVYERPGSYTLTVQHSDYETWQQDGIEVVSDDCHVIPRTIEARLSPISP